MSWTSDNAHEKVGAAMMGRSVANATHDDQSAVDAVVRAYKRASSSPASRAAIGEAVAEWAKHGDTLQKGRALQFFGLCRSARGGETLAALALSEDSGYERETPNPVQGVIGSSMREALL